MRSARVRGLRFTGIAAAEQVLEAVYRAGGEPVTVFPYDTSQAPLRITSFDGVVVPGGGDLSPRAYGAAETHEAVEAVDPLQDEMDLAVARAVLAGAVPALGICRGMQVLNVAAGGSLVQHLPPSSVQHGNAYHDVELKAGCRTAVVMGAASVRVSSYHHQAVDRVGSGFRVTGRAPDGCVEAIEHARARILAVQWHPEDDAAANPAAQALFYAVVEDARNHRRTTAATAL